MSGVTIDSAVCWMLGLSYETFKEYRYSLPPQCLTERLKVTFVLPRPRSTSLTPRGKSLVALLDKEIDHKEGNYYGTVLLSKLLNLRTDGYGYSVSDHPLAQWINGYELGHPMSELALEQGLPQVSVVCSEPKGFFILHDTTLPETIPVQRWSWVSDKSSVFSSSGTIEGIAYETTVIDDHLVRTYQVPFERILEVNKDSKFSIKE